MKTLETLFLDTLSNMYDAEQQIAKALPRMSEAALSAELKEALDAHLLETETHVQIVEQVFSCFEEDPTATKCQATAGLLEEGETLLEEFEGSPAMDAAIIFAAQKVEHYEMASYGCLKAWAGLLGNDEAADLLDGILEEEKLANATLNELALVQSNEEAMVGEESEDEDEESDSAESTMAGSGGRTR